MGVLKEVPSTFQIAAARLAAKAHGLAGDPVPDDIAEMAAWPEEKAWDYEPPAHPIPEGYDPHAD
jgi:hypothetical protein